MFDESPGSSPEKIIITLTPSIVLRYPVLLVSHRLAVVKFQRSLCDVYSTSDGFWKEFVSLQVGGISYAYGLILAKDLAISIYRKEGISGFFRAFPEYLGYLLTKDILNYVIPHYITPKVRYCSDVLANRLTDHDLFGVRSHLIQNYRYSIVTASRDDIQRQIIDFYIGEIKNSKSEIITVVIVEMLTYPLLTVISRLIIYDGCIPVNAVKLFKRILVVDGFSSFYQGFIPHLLGKAVMYTSKTFNKFIHQSLMSDQDCNSIFEQIFPVVLTIANAIVQQLSLVKRCGSQADGFCIKETNYNLLSQMPWLNIALQLAVTIGLLQLKDQLLHEHIMNTIDRELH
ncbi:hypothetical protein BEWA_006850 [Theileria equi strain WA]|uniref:Uncharacterized protein n=1 Tax=Theileria equi strain WA TaxID=1537102 RepID=L0B202_THEEQ|nr:hypothetical protein BEWA_006850 [Theileria equi strain WA]AFZ81276.1 hypothetical protein BEWA_006850 [Theileria equi strain WA]|eukprot:XP_004830942.1 hypothetical protein BEWA_006850 [Theileria equi strain WA]